MIWMLLLVWASSVCGRSAVNVAPVLYQVEENDHLTITWDSHTKTNLSLTNLICVSRLNSVKVLYQMVRGLEDPGWTHKQFSRRVLLDRDALREGRLRLHLFLLTAEDSGDYWCDLIAHYDRKTRKWGIQATVHFVLNVTQRSYEEISTSERAVWRPAEPQQMLVWAVILMLAVLTGTAVVTRCRVARRDVFHTWRREKPCKKHKEALA